MLENRRLITATHLFTQSESRKDSVLSVAFRAFVSLQRLSVALLLLVTITACSGTETDIGITEHIQILDEIPEHIREVENLTIFPGDSEPRYSIELIPEQTFGETGEPYLTTLYSTVVDDQGRVIIHNANTNTNYEHSIYVYNGNGTFYTQLGRSGRGPGEYGFVFDIQSRAGKVIVRDITNQRLNIYSMNDYTFERSMLIDDLAINSPEEVQEMEIGLIKARSDGNYLVGFSKRGFGEEYKYLLMDANGEREDFNTLIFPGSVSIKSPDKPMSPSLGLGQVMGFNLETISNYDELYSIWTKDFLIKKYNQNGIYQSAIYYSIQGLPFDLKWYETESPFGYSVSEVEKAIKNSDLEVPKTLPVLSGLMVDDENRIWAGVWMDSVREMVEWWILDESGELLAKLQRPRDKTIFDIKNGYLYAKEIDEETGAEYVVKYRMVLTEE